MIQVGIAGYGNLGRGVEASLAQNPDLSLTAVFTRRDPKSIQTLGHDVPVLPLSEAVGYARPIDVMILCGGSATDLPEQTPWLARHFNVVDSFDNHGDIPKHFAAVDRAAKVSGHLGLISCGWDPGLFSAARVYAQAVLPVGTDHTFWGPGVSQGHSDAIRRVPGVLDARQYTVPVDAAVAAVRRGERPSLTAREKHRRVCYVAAADGANLADIEAAIRTMPCYFAEYDTEVHFITLNELRRDHGGLPHGGFVVRSGDTRGGAAHTVELRLALGSNPEFTGSVLAACARAAHRMSQRGETGGRTMLDVAPGLLSPLEGEQLRATAL